MCGTAILELRTALENQELSIVLCWGLTQSSLNWAEAECLSAVTTNFEQHYCRFLCNQRCRLDLCLYSHHPHSVSWVRLWRGAVALWWWCSTAWWPTTIGCWWRASTCTACWSSPCSARGSTSTFTWLLAGVRTTTVTQRPSHINAHYRKQRIVVL